MDASYLDWKINAGDLWPTITDKWTCLNCICCIKIFCYYMDTPTKIPRTSLLALLSPD